MSAVERIGVMRVVGIAGGAGITMIDLGMRHFIVRYDVVVVWIAELVGSVDGNWAS